MAFTSCLYHMSHSSQGNKMRSLFSCYSDDYQRLPQFYCFSLFCSSNSTFYLLLMYTFCYITQFLILLQQKDNLSLLKRITLFFHVKIYYKVSFNHYFASSAHIINAVTHTIEKRLKTNLNSSTIGNFKVYKMNLIYSY